MIKRKQGHDHRTSSLPSSTPSFSCLSFLIFCGQYEKWPRPDEKSRPNRSVTMASGSNHPHAAWEVGAFARGTRGRTGTARFCRYYCMYIDKKTPHFSYRTSPFIIVYAEEKQQHQEETLLKKVTETETVHCACK